MSRLMLTICAASDGWQLYEGEEGRRWFAHRDEALATADMIAAQLHECHGIPTAVVMDMAGREAVEVSRHG
ncbi:MAG: hypothetical protein QM761_12265 [Pseudoxanthomonas sp.]